MTFTAIGLALKLSLSTKDLAGLTRRQFQFDAGSHAFIRFSNKKYGNLDRIVYVRILQRDLKLACNAAGVKNFTFTQLRSLSIVVELKNGAGTEQVAASAGIITQWFYRYNKVLNELDLSPVKLNNIKIRWNHHEK